MSDDPSHARLSDCGEQTSTPTATAEMLAGEAQPDVEHLSPQGLYFRPPDGAEGLAFAILGDTDHMAVLSAALREWRPTDSCAHGGEGGLYGRRGWVLFLDDTGILSLGGGAGRSSDDPDDAQTKPSLRLHPDGTVEVLQKSGAATITVAPDGAVTIESGDIRLGSSAPADRVALGSEVEAKLAELKSDLLNHAHPDSGVKATPTTAPSTAALGWPGNLGSGSVRVD